MSETLATTTSAHNLGWVAGNLQKLLHSPGMARIEAHLLASQINVLSTAPMDQISAQVDWKSQTYSVMWYQGRRTYGCVVVH